MLTLVREAWGNGVVVKGIDPRGEWHSDESRGYIQTWFHGGSGRYDVSGDSALEAEEEKMDYLRFLCELQGIEMGGTPFGWAFQDKFYRGRQFSLDGHVFGVWSKLLPKETKYGRFELPKSYPEGIVHATTQDLEALEGMAEKLGLPFTRKCDLISN